MLKPLLLAISVSLFAVACGGGQEEAKTPADGAGDAKAADAAKPEGDAAKPTEGDAAKPAGDAPKPADAPAPK